MTEIDNLDFIISLRKMIFWMNWKTNMVSASYWLFLAALTANIVYLNPSMSVVIFYWVWLFAYRMLFVRKVVDSNMEFNKAVIAICDVPNTLDLKYLDQFKSSEYRELIDRCLNKARKQKDKQCKKNIKN